MELISTFKHVNCPVIKFGLKKISMDYYFCYDCDKEEKFPICHSCLLKCHKGHEGSERHPASTTNLIRCSCAMNNHQTSTEETNYSLTQCFFYELNKVSDECYCYENSSKKKICVFCYCFCRPFSIMEEEFKKDFTKVKIENSNNFNCKCPSFKNSKHSAMDFMSKCLNDINKTTSIYFPFSNSVILTNLYFGSNELFRAVNKKFIAVFNQLMLEHGNRINLSLALHKNFEIFYIKIPVIVTRTYNIFKNNAKNCRKENVFFFVKEILIYFNDDVFKFFVGNLNMGIKEGKGNYRLQENFYQSFLYGFKIFNIFPNYYNSALPRYSIFEFINLNPFQRMMLRKRAKNFCSIDLKLILNTTKELLKSNASFISFKILYQLLGLVKIFARIYLLNKEQINEILKAMCLFCVEIENIYEDIKDKIELIKLYKTIAKLLIYFSFFYNDVTVMFNVYNILYKNTDEQNIKNICNTQVTDDFIYKDGEISRSVAQCIIYISKALENEYGNCQKYNAQDKRNYNITISLITILIGINLHEKDLYIPGLKFFLNNIDKESINYLLFDELNMKDSQLLSELYREEARLNYTLNDYYTSSKDLKVTLEKYSESINNILLLLLDIKKDDQENDQIKDSITRSDLSLINNNNTNTIDLYLNEAEENLKNEKENNKENVASNAESNSHSKTRKFNSSTNIARESFIEMEKDDNKNNEETLNNKIKMIQYTNIFHSLTSIFYLLEKKRFYDKKYCDSILVLLNAIIDNIPNFFSFILTKQVLKNLIYMPAQYIPRILATIKKGIKLIISERIEISNEIDYIYVLHENFLSDEITQNIRNYRGISVHITSIEYKSLAKILKIIELLMKMREQNKEFVQYLNDKLEKVDILKKTIERYIKYLLKVSEDFAKNKDNYTNNKEFNNRKLFKRYFGDNIGFNTIQKIFESYLQIIVYNIRGNTFLHNLSLIKEKISAKDLCQILKITTLNLNLRVLLIKLFLLAYCNTVIERKKLNIYRAEFQKNIDRYLNNYLYPKDQSRNFCFYNMLMNVNLPSIIEEEYLILSYEVANFNEIIYCTKPYPLDVFQNYYENGLILFLIIYLNKVFAIIGSFKGEELLKIYSLTYNILMMIKSLVNIKKFNIQNEINKKNRKNPLSYNNERDNLILEKTHDTFIKKESTCLSFYLKSTDIISKSKTEKINLMTDKEKEEKNKLINENIVKLTNPNISPMNYYNLYKILSKNLLNYFDDKLKNRINLINKKCELTEQTDLNHVNGKSNNEIYIIYTIYINSKMNYNTLCLKSVFDLNYGGNENTLRNYFIKYLLTFIVEKESIYKNYFIKIISYLLQKETTNTQNSIMYLCNRRIFTKLNVIFERCFASILSSFLSEYNPIYIFNNNEYLNACQLVNLFKLLCGGHNLFFQKIFLKQFFYSLNDIRKIGFYDLMLYILEKIIIISRWNQVKKKADFHANFTYLFKCLIEMLIEIIQGTEDSNFLNLINQKFESRKKYIINANRMDPVLQKGKAFESFLRCVRTLIIKEDHYCEELNKIRKLLMDFFLAFMEEYHCAIEIKIMIIINFHACDIIKSIARILKKMYLLKIYGVSKKITEDTVNEEEKYTFFNGDICKFFTELYFQNDNLNQHPSFQLCCSFYNYFKLTLLESKDTETIGFWKKIMQINPEDLELYDSCTQNNNNFTSNASDYEAYYVIKLFEQISKSVLVKIKEDKNPIFVIYTKPPCLDYLSDQTKNNFLEKVNRTSRNTKLIELMEQTEYFLIEAEYNFNKLRNREIMKKLCWMNYYYFKLVIFIIDAGLNCFMLSVLHERGEVYIKDYYYRIIRILSLVCCFFVFIALLIWSFTKTELYLKLERVRYMEQYRIKNIEYLTKLDKFKLYMRVFLGKGELTSLIYFLFFRILGSIKRSFAFFYSFSLIAVMTLSDTLINLTQSLVLKGKQLIWVVVFTILVLYIYGGWGFYFLNNRFYDEQGREEPENMCYSLLYCFYTLINNGMRWYPGVGKYLRLDSPLIKLGEYIHHYVYHFSFYLLIRVMMLKIVFGIILDSFTELREFKSNIEKDMKFKCFICNIEKDECEKKNQDFNKHCQETHNVWDYANYMIMLRMADFKKLNGVNFMCKKMIIEKQMKWIPDNDTELD